jgi:hypothetical protein
MDEVMLGPQKEIAKQSVEYVTTTDARNKGDAKKAASEATEPVYSKEIETQDQQKDANRRAVEHTKSKDMTTSSFYAQEDSETQETGKPWSHYIKGVIFVLSGALIQFGFIYVLYHHVFGRPVDFWPNRHPVQQDLTTTPLVPPITFSDASPGDHSPRFTVERAVYCAKLHNWILKHSHEAFDAKSLGLNYTWPVDDQASSNGELAKKTKEEEDKLITEIYRFQSGEIGTPTTIDRLDVDKFKQLPLYILLTGLNYTPQVDDFHETAFLTPLVENAQFWKWKFFPLPWPKSLPHPKTIITLFPGHSVRLSQNFIFDYKTGMAAWAPFQWDMHPLPKARDWAPLEYFLESWKKEWQIGRFYWHSVSHAVQFSQGPTSQRWMPEYDLDPAIQEWHSLLETIQSRLPNAANITDQRNSNDSSLWLPPVAANVSEQTFREAASYDTFSTTFLAVAKRPAAFKYVAPGIAVWSDSEFTHQIDRLVKEDEARHKSILNGGQELYKTTPLGFPLLLATVPISSNHGLERLNLRRLTIPFDWSGTWWDEENLEEEKMKKNDQWIYSGLLDNKLGLYSTDNDYVGGSYWLILERHANQTLKVDDGYQRMFVALFGQGSANTGYQGRGGKAALIFRKFREFVESGVWQIGPDGVSTGVEWFQDAENRNLTWLYNE